jgi:hypothetical protein
LIAKIINFSFPLSFRSRNTSAQTAPKLVIIAVHIPIINKNTMERTQFEDVLSLDAVLLLFLLRLLLGLLYVNQPSQQKLVGDIGGRG